MAQLTHFNEQGASRMVNISNKEITDRIAVAHAKITMKPETFRLIMDKKIQKGDVFEVARVAGIMAASVCAITIYDMCKSADKGMVISDIHLIKKSGGKSGTFIFDENSA